MRGWGDRGIALYGGQIASPHAVDIFLPVIGSSFMGDTEYRSQLRFTLYDL